ncbi:hypothetical protein C8Q77DRAFT_1209859 [Trametes polyzona]|nr:hypothetical protein C8Q77DRAFT_1209859 [Trametes polyzona]
MEPVVGELEVATIPWIRDQDAYERAQRDLPELTRLLYQKLSDWQSPEAAGLRTLQEPLVFSGQTVCGFILFRIPRLRRPIANQPHANGIHPDALPPVISHHLQHFYRSPLAPAHPADPGQPHQIRAEVFAIVGVRRWARADIIRLPSVLQAFAALSRLQRLAFVLCGFDAGTVRGLDQVLSSLGGIRQLTFDRCMFSGETIRHPLFLLLPHPPVAWVGLEYLSLVDASAPPCKIERPMHFLILAALSNVPGNHLTSLQYSLGTARELWNGLVTRTLALFPSLSRVNLMIRHLLAIERGIPPANAAPVSHQQLQRLTITYQVPPDHLAQYRDRDHLPAAERDALDAAARAVGQCIPEFEVVPL